MTTKFDELCKLMSIDQSSCSSAALGKLINWCEATISTDCHFTGDLQERFSSYKVLASEFLEKVQPNIHADKLTDPVPAFNDMSPLQFIVDKGLDSYLQVLHPSPAQINTPINSFTLLQLAATRGHLHTTEVLLSLGAKDTKDMSILFSTLMLPITHDAKMIQNKQSIYSLLSKGKAPKDIANAKNEFGDTVLHIMSVYGYSKLVEEILTKVRGIAAIANNLGHYPIHSAILNGQHDCVKVLIDVDGVAQLTDAKGRNALHYAAKYGDGNMIQICLKSIPRDSVDKRGRTPLIIAFIANNTAAAKELLVAASSAEINSTDDDHRSALHYAVESNNVELVKLLLASPDIEVNNGDYYSHNPLDLIKQNDPDGAVIRDLLIAKGAISAQASAKNGVF